MNIVYSKLLLSSVIATSCFMMSCQKKGSARTGVQAQTVTAKQTDNKNPNTTDGGTLDPQQPGPAVQPVKPSVSTSNDTTPAVTTSNDTTPSVTTSTDTSPSVTTSTDTSPSVTTSHDVTKPSVTTSSDTTKPPVVTSGDDTKVKTAECSADIIKAKANLIDRVGKAKADDKDSKVSKEEKIKTREEVLSLCSDLSGLFVTAKIESCLIKSEKSQAELKNTSSNNDCYTNGEELKKLTGKDNFYTLEKAKQENIKTIAAFAAVKRVFSEEAKGLLDLKNQDFKKYIIDGKIQSDEKALVEAVKAKKVVCSLTTEGEVAYTEDTKVIMTTTKVEKLVPADTKAVIQSGVDIKVSLDLASKSKVDLDEKDKLTKAGVLACANLNADKLNTTALKATLGAVLKAETK